MTGWGLGGGHDPFHRRREVARAHVSDVALTTAKVVTGAAVRDKIPGDLIARAGFGESGFSGLAPEYRVTVREATRPLVIIREPTARVRGETPRQFGTVRG